MSGVASEFWNKDRVARLMQMLAEDYSASQIAADLGAVSRCAVLGKINRLGLSSPLVRRKPRNAPSKSASLKPRVLQQVGPVAVRRSAPLALKAAPEPPPDAISDTRPSRRRTLLELGDRHCRWPFGHPTAADFFFCGDPSAALSEGRPYCAQHARMAYAR